MNSHEVHPITSRSSVPGWATRHPVTAFLVLLFTIGYLVMSSPILAGHGVTPPTARSFR